LSCATFKDFKWLDGSVRSSRENDFFINLKFKLLVKNESWKSNHIERMELIPIDELDNVRITYPIEISRENIPALTQKEITGETWMRIKKLVADYSNGKVTSIHTPHLKLFLYDMNGNQIIDTNPQTVVAEIEIENIRTQLEELIANKGIQLGSQYAFWITQYNKNGGAELVFQVY